MPGDLVSQKQDSRLRQCLDDNIRRHVKRHDSRLMVKLGSSLIEITAMLIRCEQTSAPSIMATQARLCSGWNANLILRGNQPLDRVDHGQVAGYVTLQCCSFQGPNRQGTNKPRAVASPLAGRWSRWATLKQADSWDHRVSGLGVCQWPLNHGQSSQCDNP